VEHFGLEGPAVHLAFPDMLALQGQALLVGQALPAPEQVVEAAEAAEADISAAEAVLLDQLLALSLNTLALVEAPVHLSHMAI
jgi:hypothetical protein